MKSKINANRALVAKKAKLTKLFTLLTILTLGITNVWAANVPAAAGTYELKSANKPGNTNRFYKLGDGVYIHRRTNSSQDDSGIKNLASNDNGVAVYVNSPIDLSCLIKKSSSKNEATVRIDVFTLTNGTTAFDGFETGTNNSSTVSVTLSSSATYTTSVTFAALTSNAAEDKSSSKITLAAGYYYIVPVETTNTGKVTFKSITLTSSCSCSITTQPTGATLAIGDANPELSIVATHADSYAWKESSDGTSKDGAVTLGTNATFTPEVNDAVQTKYYYCEVTSDCDGSTVVSSNIVTVNVVGSITYYTVTLNPAGGTIADATGWTLNAGNYEKEVAEGTELTLPTFTKVNRTFNTWRKAGPADVASPVTVDGDLSLTAIWTATIENVIYSWEGAEGGAIEAGGTATSSTDGGSSFDDAELNVKEPQTNLYCLKVCGNNSYGTNIIQINLSGEEKVKTGDKIKYWGFYSKDSEKNARPKMRDGNTPNAEIFNDGTNLPNLYSGGDPAERTFTVPASINTNKVQITRSQTGSNTWISKLQIIREAQVEEGDLLTVTLNYNDGVTPNATIQVASGQAVAKPADPTKAQNRFKEWQLAGSTYNFASPVTSNITLDAVWTQLYTISFNNGGGTGDAPAAIADKAQGETFEVPANTFTAPDSKVFDIWNDGSADFAPGDTYTVGTSNVTLTAVWRTPTTMYEITKGTHENGDFTIDPATQEAGETVTLAATPNDGYLFGAWEVVKTEDGTDAGVTVTSNQFAMPGFAVTVNATFVADTRAKILYVTNNNEANTKANDKLYAALKDDYRITIVSYDSDADQTNYDLVVLHESVGGGNYNATAVAAAKTGSTPVLNTKSYFYNDGRWNWGTPNAGKTIKGATLNSAYCNIASHPLFAGVTVSDGFFEITDDAVAKCMQPIGSFVAGKEGYTLATTPNNDSGEGCAIHELTPEQRGVASGKYLMISVLGDKLNALNANGQKLFQNAVAYLLDATPWTPVLAPGDAVVTATPNSAYAEGQDIALAVSATGTNASTTYTWYKGATLEAAIAGGAIQTAKTEAEGGNAYAKAACVAGDAGIYWCVIHNGEDCEASASLEVTISAASNITFVSAHGTAPAATTGASYTLPELTESGWAHQGWTASINVTVDEAEVVAGTTIANGKVASFDADVEFTAVWAQVFEVTFNMQDHGDAIDPQNIVSGGKVTKPADPFEAAQEFGGWYKEPACENAWNFDVDVVNATTVLYAKWTAFEGCFYFYPTETSGNLHLNDVIPGTSGGAMVVSNINDNDDGDGSTSIVYTENGLGLTKGNTDRVKVTLANMMTVGTKITVELVSGGTSTARGLYLTKADDSNVTSNPLLGWSSGPIENGQAGTFDYTVVANDGLDGNNAFILKRQNTVYIKSIKVTSCGAVPVTVTFKQADETVIDTKVIDLGDNVTAPEAPHISAKRFLGWSETVDGALVNLATTAIVADITFYAVYEDVICPTGGNLFSLAFDAAATADPGIELTVNKNNPDVLITASIATVSAGGNAYFGTTNNGDVTILVKDGETAFRESNSNNYIKVVLDCPLQVGDIISFTTSTTRELNFYNGNPSASYVSSSSKKVTVENTEHALYNADIIYIKGGNAACTLMTLNVTRPAKYDVSFDLMGHGSAIADIVGVIDGSKIVAPTAPTDVDYAFSGWFKENTFANEWDFENDVVTDNITLYAKWVDRSDATLKSLKYGTTEIALEDGVYTYAVNLSPLATDVPALTAVPSNPNATAVVTDAAALDGEGHATSTVVVTPELGGSPQTYTVNFTKLNIYTELADVTETTNWDWNGVATGEVKINDVAVRGLILANYIDAPNFEKLEGQEGARAYRSNDYPAYQGTYLRFHATKPGRLTMNVRNSSGSPKLYVNGGEVATLSGTRTNYNVIVPAGDVIITSTDGDMRIYSMDFNADPDYKRDASTGDDWMAPGELGTVCIPNGAVAFGGDLYTLEGKNSDGKIVFATVPNNRMTPGVPYLFQATSNAMKFYYTDEATVAAPDNNGAMKSTFEDGVVLSGDDLNDVYYFNGHALWNAAALTELPVVKYRAYVKMDEVQEINTSNHAPGRRYIIMDVHGQNATTGFGEVQGDDVQCTKVLINGQLFILRGEKMYDTTGRLVK